MNKSKALWVLISLSVVVFVCLALSPLIAKIIRRHTLKDKGDVIISKVEVYKAKHGKLPETLGAINVAEEEVFYRIEDRTNYIIWFGEELGESCAYRSEQRHWSGVSDHMYWMK